MDVDLDHPRAVELASQFLPATPLMFGRSGKPRSHWLYRVTGPVVTQKHRSKSAGMIVELRSTGTQTVFPPSVHPSGEAIQWVDEEAEPAEIGPDELLAACKSLADASQGGTGENGRRKTAGVPSPLLVVRSWCTLSYRPLHIDVFAGACQHETACLDDKSDGSFRLFTTHPVGGHVLPLRGNRVHPGVRERTLVSSRYDTRSSSSASRRREAMSGGTALETEVDGLVKWDPRPGDRPLVLSAAALHTAEAFIRDFHTHPDGWTLRS